MNDKNIPQQYHEDQKPPRQRPASDKNETLTDPAAPIAGNGSSGKEDEKLQQLNHDRQGEKNTNAEDETLGIP